MIETAIATPNSQFRPSAGPMKIALTQVAPMIGPVSSRGIHASPSAAPQLEAWSEAGQPR